MFEVAEFITYSGAVYPEQKWQTTEPMLNLTTDIPGFPWRAIPLSWIQDLRVDGQNINITLPESTETRTWTAEGSRGNTYTVTRRGAKLSCTCPGFQFRHNCRHITEKETV
jgi:hypothetical protein